MPDPGSKWDSFVHEKLRSQPYPGLARRKKPDQGHRQAQNRARRLGTLPPNAELTESNYDQVKIAPPGAIERVLSFGTPFQLIEQPFKDEVGMTHFVNVHLLRLQDSQAKVQGVLYLVEDKTRD